MDNILSNINDSITINIVSKVGGLVSLTDYTDIIKDVLTGETDASGDIKREFRVTLDEIFYTEWKELNLQNISSFSEKIIYQFLIQVKYTRISKIISGDIKFVSITINGNFQNIEYKTPTIYASIFSSIINSKELLDLERNLFKKLYFRGIVPNYITRGDNRDRIEDADYIALTSAIARYYAMFILFSKRFENFSSDYDLLRAFISQFGIYYNESSITLPDLQYLSKYFYKEIHKRGTSLIFKQKGDILLDGSSVPIDGEFVRLLRISKNDELLIEKSSFGKTGWCLGKSSPLYRGTLQSPELNKTLENTQDFKDLSKYDLHSTNHSNYSIINDSGYSILSLNCNESSESQVGIGSISGTPSKLILVDTSLSYEIGFWFKIPTSSSANVNNLIHFGVEGFDVLKNKLNDSFIIPNGFTTSEIFIEDLTSKFKKNIWCYFRGIINSYATETTSKIISNIGNGNNLYFNNKFTKFISPKIFIRGINENLNLWDFKIRPLVRGNNIMPLKDGSVNSHSLGFVNCSSLIYIYAKNNNNNISEEDLNDIIEKYLFPYDSVHKINYI